MPGYESEKPRIDIPGWNGAATCLGCLGMLGLAMVLAGGTRGQGQEPPALNPFGGAPTREDAIPGYIQLSDDSVLPGSVYLTRDHRLKVLDQEQKRQREVPLSALSRVDCKVLREWMEKEWRFKENANDQKVFTGREYPAREYLHTLTLKDGRKITGDVSAIVYVQVEGSAEPDRFLIHQRDKGSYGMALDSLLFVRTIELGDEALAQGKLLAEKKSAEKKKSSVKSAPKP